MLISRRAFGAGTLSLALSAGAGASPTAQSGARSAALAAINAYGLEHLSHFGLSGITLGLTTPDGFSTVMNFGYSNRETRSPITPATLFQIGSISKLINSAILHQFAEAGKLRLNDRISTLLPSIPLPSGNVIEVQHLLDHVAGLPSDAPLFPDGGLWTAYTPGQHWHYSNTGYEILGKLIEHLGGKPLGRIAEERIFAPLGMRQTRGAIVDSDRGLYAQGYEAADELPFAIGVPLAPAAWVDTTAGAGNVASTAADMSLLLRSLAAAAQGRGGLGLSPAGGKAYATHAVTSDERGMSYGNGLMHVHSGTRAYLHHTGGMVSFSSSFHVDVASGVGAFASSPISAFADYRPRLLTQFAVDALTNASAGGPLPLAPALEARLANASAYIGSYSGPSGAFEVRGGRPLTIVAGGQSATLQPNGSEVFTTAHPAFRAFSFMFERHENSVTAVNWGPSTFLRSGSSGQLPASDPELAKLAGRYVNDSPWFGLAQIVERGGRLWLGTEVPMDRTGDNLWRIGEERWSPERGSFSDPIDGRPQTFIFSGAKFTRHEA